MTTCPGCNSSFDDVWNVWMCNWCVGNVCDRCYVDHTSTHESIHSPSVAQKRKTEKCGAVFESAKCDLAWGHDSADHADKGVTWPRNAV